MFTLPDPPCAFDALEKTIDANRRTDDVEVWRQAVDWGGVSRRTRGDS